MDSHLFAQASQHEEVYFGPEPVSLTSDRKTANGDTIADADMRPDDEFDPDLLDIWHGNTRDCEALKTSASYKELVTSIRTTKQVTSVVARPSATAGRLEVIAGASRLTAIREINATGDGPKRFIKVEIRDMTDAEAVRLVTAENAGRSPLSPIEQARFYRQAIDNVYGTDAALGKALGLDKSNIGRTLTILDLPDVLLELIADPRQISARQAVQFMQSWKEPILQRTLAFAIGTFADAPASASKVMKAMADAIAPPTVPGVEMITLDGEELGTVRRTKSGKLRIDLDGIPAPGESVQPLIEAIGRSLKQLAS